MVGVCGLKHEVRRQTLENKNYHNKIAHSVHTVDFVPLNVLRTPLIETCVWMVHNIHIKYFFNNYFLQFFIILT